MKNNHLLIRSKHNNVDIRAHAEQLWSDTTDICATGDVCVFYTHNAPSPVAGVWAASASRFLEAQIHNKSTNRFVLLADAEYENTA